MAQLVLRGAYEATLLVAALLARRRQERVLVFLTALGGGAFVRRAFFMLRTEAVAEIPLRFCSLHLRFLAHAPPPWSRNAATPPRRPHNSAICTSSTPRRGTARSGL